MFTIHRMFFYVWVVLFFVGCTTGPGTADTGRDTDLKVTHDIRDAENGDSARDIKAGFAIQVTPLQGWVGSVFHVKYTGDGTDTQIFIDNIPADFIAGSKTLTGFVPVLTVGDHEISVRYKGMDSAAVTFHCSGFKAPAHTFKEFRAGMHIMDMALPCDKYGFCDMQDGLNKTLGNIMSQAADLDTDEQKRLISVFEASGLYDLLTVQGKKQSALVDTNQFLEFYRLVRLDTLSFSLAAVKTAVTHLGLALLKDPDLAGTVLGVGLYAGLAKTVIDGFMPTNLKALTVDVPKMMEVGKPYDITVTGTFDAQDHVVPPFVDVDIQDLMKKLGASPQAAAEADVLMQNQASAWGVEYHDGNVRLKVPGGVQPVDVVVDIRYFGKSTQDILAFAA